MILPRYFVLEALKISAMIVAGLFVLYISTRFATHLGEAAAGKVAPQHITRIIMLKMLVSLKDIVPIGLFLGTYAAITRLQQGSEWVAMRAAGVTHQQLLFPAFAMAGAASLLVASITFVIGPRAELTLRELREQTESEATIAGVKAGRFKELSGGKRVFYAESISADEKYLENAFVRSQSGDDSGSLRSKRAFIELRDKSGDRFAVFEDGRSYAGTPGQLNFVITDFSRYALRVENREPTQFGAHIGFLLTSELWRLKGAQYATELQWRLALPISTLLGPGLALLVGLAMRGGRWYLGLITALSGYFAYTNLLGVGRALMKKEILSTTIGLWPIHLVFVLILLGLLMWHRRKIRLKPMPRQELLPA
ncbi:MAG: LPS export ABC transporter permease LptF [Gammaproteobacteria bacterium]|nr:LPS export ABC transporter permease LptF [Gammaproteobacteria bacterium]